MLQLKDMSLYRACNGENFEVTYRDVSQHALPRQLVHFKSVNSADYKEIPNPLAGGLAISSSQYCSLGYEGIYEDS